MLRFSVVRFKQWRSALQRRPFCPLWVLHAVGFSMTRVVHFVVHHSKHEQHRMCELLRNLKFKSALHGVHCRVITSLPCLGYARWSFGQMANQANESGRSTEEGCRVYSVHLGPAIAGRLGRRGVLGYTHTSTPLKSLRNTTTPPTQQDARKIWRFAAASSWLCGTRVGPGRNSTRYDTRFPTREISAGSPHVFRNVQNSRLMSLFFRILGTVFA